MPTASYESLTEWIDSGVDPLPAVCTGCEYGASARCHVCPLFGAEPTNGYAYGSLRGGVDCDDIVNARQHAAFCGTEMSVTFSFECPVCGRVCLGVPEYVLGNTRNAVRLCRECFNQLDTPYEVALNTYLIGLPNAEAQMRAASQRNCPDVEDDHIFRTRTCDVCGEETTVGSSSRVATSWGDGFILCYECSRGHAHEWVNNLLDARPTMENFLTRAHRESSAYDEIHHDGDSITNHCTCHVCGEYVRESDGGWYGSNDGRGRFVCDSCRTWFTMCASCDEIVPSWQIVRIGGIDLCPGCEVKYFICSVCGNLRTRERMSEEDGICRQCHPHVVERTLAAYYQACAGALASEEMAYTDEPEWVCHECHGILSLDDDEQFDTPNGPVCEECYGDMYFTCERCEEVRHTDNSVTVQVDSGEQTWCDDCAADHAYRCDDCGNRCSENMVHGDDNSDTMICEGCYMDHWTYCDACGCLVHHDDTCYDERNEVDLCGHCYDNREVEPDYDSHDRRDWIRGYEHTEARYFYDGGDDDHDVDRTRSGRSGGSSARGKTLYLSPEVEFDSKRDDGDWTVIREIMRAHSDELVITEDGSLDYGAEIKTEPRTLAAHYAFEWTDIMTRMVRAGWRAHDVVHPGLHVHLSRAAFDDEGHVAKFVLLFHRLWDQLATFSRRHEFGYCKRYDDIHDEDTVYDVYSKARNQNSSDRNLCVNLRRRDTVEVRLWKGTLNAGTFYATLELCHLMFHVSRETNITDLHTYSWAQVKERANTYKHLPAYLERRGL